MVYGKKHMNKDSDLTIIIVSFNTREILKRCLASIYKSLDDDITSEVIVVDNGSTDQSPDMVMKYYPKAILISNADNIGYAKANNQGIHIAKGRYILFLNSDTELMHRTLGRMVHFMDNNKEAGAATCRVDLPDGRMDPACHRGFPTPWASFTYFTGLEAVFPRSKMFSQYHLGYLDTQIVHEIDSPTGAFFLVRKDTISDVGMLDEEYFMYGEDLDLAFRIKEKGWKILFIPDAYVIHIKKQSGLGHSNKTLRRKVNRYFYDAMELFYEKHYHKRYGQVITYFVLAAIRLLRAVSTI